MALSIIRTVCNNISNFTKYSININKNIYFYPSYGLKNYSQLINPLQGEVATYNQETNISNDVIKIVNEVQKTTPSRSFAVVQICGKQFKITSGDAIVIEGYWPPTIGDQIRLEKVLLAGSKDFSLIGAPLVQNGLVVINATVIEKALSHTKTHFRKKRRKQYMRLNFYRCERTVLRINDIKIGQLDDV